jgi:dipeptidase E
VDLSPYFELGDGYNPDELDTLLTCDAIHLSGGNTYYFLHWLRVRNLLIRLREYVARGGVLIGVSAGAILMTPNIGSASLCGDMPLEGMTDYAALGLVDFAFVPHLNEKNRLGAVEGLFTAVPDHCLWMLR